MAYSFIVTSGILLMLANQNSALRFLLFVGHDEMNYTDAREACENTGGILAAPSSFTEEEKLDVMQCIPPNTVFWTNQKGSKDACLINYHLEIKCFYQRRYYTHAFLCEAERDSFRYTYYVRVGDVCNNPDHSLPTLSQVLNFTTPTPIRPTKRPVSIRTARPIRTKQTIGTQSPGGDGTTSFPAIISTWDSYNETNVDNRNKRKETGNMSNIGTTAAVIIFILVLAFTVLGILYVYFKRKKPDLLRRASFWKKPEPAQNEYDTVHPRPGQEHSYGCMRASDPHEDYLQPNPSAIRSRNIDNIDYLVEADDNIISGVDTISSNGQSTLENDYDYIHIDDTNCSKPPQANTYSLARAIPITNDYEKCNQSQPKDSKFSSQHDYYNTFKAVKPNAEKKTNTTENDYDRTNVT